MNQIIQDLTKNLKETDLTEHVYRGCKTNGIVKMLHRCKDPNCKGCNHFNNEFDKAMKAELKKL